MSDFNQGCKPVEVLNIFCCNLRLLLLVLSSVNMRRNLFICVMTFLIYLKTKKDADFEVCITLTDHNKLFVGKSRKTWEKKMGDQVKLWGKWAPPSLEHPANKKGKLFLMSFVDVLWDRWHRWHFFFYICHKVRHFSIAGGLILTQLLWSPLIQC